ncbi:hypothetical protein C0993_009160 [Termitomyces sp. T159_Od127]|nr:hypothetical protein C0993_009160 [Termitomyces sp. T159_Od127]
MYLLIYHFNTIHSPMDNTTLESLRQIIDGTTFSTEFASPNCSAGSNTGDINNSMSDANGGDEDDNALDDSERLKISAEDAIAKENEQLKDQEDQTANAGIFDPTFDEEQEDHFDQELGMPGAPDVLVEHMAKN